MKFSPAEMQTFTRNDRNFAWHLEKCAEFLQDTQDRYITKPSYAKYNRKYLPRDHYDMYRHLYTTYGPDYLNRWTQVSPLRLNFVVKMMNETHVMQTSLQNLGLNTLQEIKEAGCARSRYNVADHDNTPVPCHLRIVTYYTDTPVTYEYNCASYSEAAKYIKLVLKDSTSQRTWISRVRNHMIGQGGCRQDWYPRGFGGKVEIIVC